MLAPDAPRAQWRKSSRSNGAQNCVEIAHMRNMTAVRDSKSPTGPILMLSPDGFEAFLLNTQSSQPES